MTTRFALQEEIAGHLERIAEEYLQAASVETRAVAAQRRSLKEEIAAEIVWREHFMRAEGFRKAAQVVRTYGG